MRRLVGSSCFAALLALAAVPPFALPRAAHADDTSERKSRAYALIAEGKTRFDLGKFDEAIDLFQKAYEVYPYPEALYSMAQAYRMKKDYEHAVFFYKSYLRNASADAPNRDTVEARVQEMEQLIAAQKAQATKPPQGVEKPPAPDGAPSPAAPDEAAKPAPAAGQGAPAVPPPAPSPAPWYRDGWGWTLAAGGALAAGAGAWIVADGTRSCEPGDQLCADDERSARGERILGYSLAGAGAATLVWGIVKLALTDEAPRRDVALVVGDRYLGLAGTF